jgi:hypothetical protein
MDELLLSLKNFNISNNKEAFESDLDYVINQLNKQELDDPNREWETIRENYKKIKYLEKLVSEYIKNLDITDNNYNDKFMFILGHFMEWVDKNNIHYILDIDWDGHRNEVENCEQIKQLLEKSVNLSNSIEKLQVCVEAYDLFIPIIEEFRGEKILKDDITDIDFLNSFNIKRKKHKN